MVESQYVFVIRKPLAFVQADNNHKSDQEARRILNTHQLPFLTLVSNEISDFFA